MKDEDLRDHIRRVIGYRDTALEVASQSEEALTEAFLRGRADGLSTALDSLWVCSSGQYGENLATPHVYAGGFLAGQEVAYENGARGHVTDDAVAHDEHVPVRWADGTTSPVHHSTLVLVTPASDSGVSDEPTMWPASTLGEPT